MEGWKVGIEKTLEMVLFHPGSMLEMWILLGVGFLTCLVVYSKMAGATDMVNTGPMISPVAVALGLFVMTLAITASHLYLLPRFNPHLGVWLTVVVTVAASLLLVIPLLCGMLKGSYMAGLTSWTVSVAAMALVVYVVGAGFQAFSSGSRDFNRAADHKHEIEQILQ